MSHLRRGASSLLATAITFFAASATAQPPPEQPAPTTTAAPTATAPPTAPPPTPTPPAEPGRPPASAPSEATPAPMPTLPPLQLLAPKFPEDRYPGEPNEPGLMPGIPLNGKGLQFAMHGYFRAPMRITKAQRPGSDTANWRTPYLVDDSYFNSGFAYTPVNESDFTELYLSVGNEHLTGTVQFQGSLYSDAARPIIDQQLGISQGYLTYRASPDLIEGLKTRIKVKGGAFWDRFGYIPKYDTYLFARTHQMGEQVRLEVEKGPFIVWLLDGIGTHLEDVSSNEGLTLLHYASAGVSFENTIEAGVYWMNAAENDEKPLKEIVDANLNVKGFDVRVDSHVGGKLYAATSWVDGRNATYEAPALELMHSYGGRGLSENYWGTQASDHGTGSMWNVGLQYDVSFDDVYREAAKGPPPIPFNGDVVASIFGLYSYVNSNQSSADPLVNKNARQYFKYGAEVGHRVTEWFGYYFRYDRVVLDTGDSADSFRILSPRIAFFTSLLTHEQLFLQYSRYVYNERIRLRPGQVQLETIPDDHVLKIQAQIVF